MSQIPPSSRRRPGFIPACEYRFPWIPAFAGMTDSVDESAFSAMLPHPYLNCRRWFFSGARAPCHCEEPEATRQSQSTHSTHGDCFLAMTGRRYEIYPAQFSRRRPGTRSNSPTLFVTRMSPFDLAWPAIIISYGPIGFPIRYSSALI